LRLFDAVSGQELVALPPARCHWFSPSGTLFAAKRADESKIRVWDVPRRKPWRVVRAIVCVVGRSDGYSRTTQRAPQKQRRFGPACGEREGVSVVAKLWRSWLRLIAAAIMAATVAVLMLTPSRQLRLDDMTVSAARILERLPEVQGVHVYVPAKPPRSRIIHLLDVHTIPKAQFAAWIEAREKTRLSEEESERRYAGQIDQVNNAQANEIAVVIPLAAKNGLREIFVEGLTKESVNKFLESVEHFKRDDPTAVSWDRVYRDSKAKGDKHGEEEALTILKQWNLVRAKLGTGAKLLAMGVVDKVVPAEDLDALACARKLVAGELVVRKKANDAREDAMVRNILSRGRFGFIILGAAHDLTESIKRLAPDCEYLRVMPKGTEEKMHWEETEPPVRPVPGHGIIARPI
jgi:hypothetical protein